MTESNPGADAGHYRLQALVLNQILSEMFTSAKPVTRYLRGGLVLVYTGACEQGRTFKVGRLNVEPSDKEIEVLVRDAKLVGVYLDAKPKRMEVKSKQGTYHVHEWTPDMIAFVATCFR